MGVKGTKNDFRISEFDRFLFAEGTHYDIYEKMGAHMVTCEGKKGVYFAVWAPHAAGVSVVGDFNGWDTTANYMTRLDDSGIYEVFIPGVKEGAIYKYFIRTNSGKELYKADPFANHAQMRPETASVVTNLNRFKWSDKEYIKERKKTDRETRRKEKMAIYEMHLGSWKKKDDGTEDGFYNYRELAPMVADYIKEMGYTHVELMGIMEHPFDGSWGYQVTGYYAPTSRYGSPEDFMYFIDYLHSEGIAVILDWVPAHFPRDAHGLAYFDGEALFEHPDTRRGEHPHWGTLIFNYGLNEVSGFIAANALFWVEKFHIDALRVDAVASMLYLDYGKNDGEWLPNENGGKENTDAIKLLQKINTVLEERNPGTYLIAEESTAWAGVTAPVSMGGLGFLYKWNMGWMNDFLEYMKLDPYFRQFNHNKLTFSLMYAYSENFIQVLSHDEVVHMKGSMINKMPGDDAAKFANLKAAYGFMYGHPGKKFLFMGQEFAQYREWSEKRELDWFLLEDKKHQEMQNYVKDLNKLYKKYPAMYVNDCSPEGFEWINCNDYQKSLVSFVRNGDKEDKTLLFVCNFTPNAYDEFKVGLPKKARLKEVFNSDSVEYGGSGNYMNEKLSCKKDECDGREYSTIIKVPPLSVCVIRLDVYKTKAEKETEKIKKVK